jgi:sulfotransferase family protein
MTASTDAPTSAPARGQIVPDFFIVGNHKSGTTALYQMLRRHPQIFMPAVKEPRYLAADLRTLAPSAPGQPETLQEYLALFAEAAPGQRVGEASPSYLRSREAASAIAALQPNARIIALFREPASFVRSLHLHLLEEGVEREPDLATAVRDEQLVRAGQTVLRYSDHVRYTEQLRRYREVFAPEQLLVLIYEEFRADNRGTLRTVLRFLGVDEDVELPAIEANPSYAVRSPRLNGAMRSLGGDAAAARAARRTVVALVPRRVRHGALRLVRRRVLYGPPPEPDERVMAELRERYRPEVEAFGEYLGRDLLTLWGYRGG